MPTPKCESCPQPCNNHDGECFRLPDAQDTGITIPEGLDIHTQIRLLTEIGNSHGQDD